MSDYLANPYVIKALMSAGLALAVFVLSRIALSVAARRDTTNSEAPYAIRYSALTFFALGLLVIWLEGLGPILTALTIVAAALTIVSKELILNFLGSFIIFWRELFAIGDRIRVGDHAGDVVDKGLLYFTLIELDSRDAHGHSTGRLIKVPNGLVLTVPVINATRGAGYVWNDLDVVITPDSDRNKARQLLLDCARRYMEERGIDPERVKASFESRNVYFSKVDPRVYVSLASGGVRLTLRYLCRTRKVRDGVDSVTGWFLDGAAEQGITLAPEQQ